MEVIEGRICCDSREEKILPDGDAELIWQFSIPNYCKRTVSIWCR